MVDFAESHNSAELRHLTAHLVEVLSPDTTDELETNRLERQEHRAQTRRHLGDDGDGSVPIRGSLPIADTEPLIQIVHAYAAAHKRGLERLDPQAEYPTPAIRRADGPLAIATAHSHQALAPKHGEDRIVITLSLDKLTQQCAELNLAATQIRDGQPLAASLVRRLLCDADILPAILSTTSEPLDVGRAQLELRDQGCIDPG